MHIRTKSGADLEGLFLSLDAVEENPVSNIGTPSELLAQGAVVADQAHAELHLDVRLNRYSLNQTFLNIAIVISDRFRLQVRPDSYVKRTFGIDYLSRLYPILE